jgi:hypothetical protein
MEIKLRLRNLPWLFKKQIQHQKFGRLWYINDRKNIKNSHYQGYTYFAPVNKEIDIFLTSKVEFDSNQTLFFDEIEENYQVLYPECIMFLENHFKTKFEDLILCSISISKSSKISQSWSLIYFSRKNNLLNINIEFQDWEIKRVK